MRVLTRVVSLVVAVAVGAVAVVTAVEVILALVGASSWTVDHGTWLDTARTTRWDQGSVRLVLGAALLVGVVLLALAAVPRPPVTVAARSGPDRDVGGEAGGGEAGGGEAGGGDVVAEVRRRALEDLIEQRVAGLPFVSGADVVVRSAAVLVSVAAAGSPPESLRAEVGRRVRVVLDRYGLASLPVRVRVRAASGRAA
jgi:hypothetical protein